MSLEPDNIHVWAFADKPVVVKWITRKGELLREEVLTYERGGVDETENGDGTAGD